MMEPTFPSQQIGEGQRSESAAKALEGGATREVQRGVHSRDFPYTKSQNPNKFQCSNPKESNEAASLGFGFGNCLKFGAWDLELPVPRGLMSTTNAKTWNWGLLGPGRFAREFADELRSVERAKLVAVGSRDLEKAQDFADDFGFERAYGTYDEFFADTEIDIVYIVVPHVFHADLAKAALESGKAVLCEKPLTPNANETRDLVKFAEQKGCFLMEAMKTGFLPAMLKAKEWIAAGRIGEPKLAKADFCFQGPTDPQDRLMNPELAGGAVLDVGIYPLYLTRFLLGEVTEIHATGSLASTGVEDSAAMITKHEGGASSAMTCSFRTEEAMDAVILGTEGEIRIPKFHAAIRTELWRDGKLLEACDDNSGGMVKAEIDAVHESLDQGKIECSFHRHHDSIRLAEVMDEVRHQLGSQTPTPS